MANVVDSASSEKLYTRPLPGASVTPWAFAEDDRRPLLEPFGLTTGFNSNIVFVGIDFENLANIKTDLSQNLDSEVRLAILDTKDLDSVPSTELIST